MMISATTTTSRSTIRWSASQINKSSRAAAAATTLTNYFSRVNPVVGGGATQGTPEGLLCHHRPGTHHSCCFSTSAATSTTATNDIHHLLQDDNNASSKQQQQQQQQQQQLREPNPEMVDTRQAPSDYISSSAVVYKDFITVEEEKILVKELQACMKRRRYEKGHWDAVIVNYKETELIDEETLLSETSRKVLDRVRYQLKERHLSLSSSSPGQDNDNDDDITWLPCHAIDLHKTGQLNAHVDSVRFSGDIVAGLSFLSSSIMRLRPDDDGEEVTGLCCSSSNDDDQRQDQVNEINNNTSNNNNESAIPKINLVVNWVDLFLPPRSLYVLSDAARYHYSHQLLPSGSFFVGQGPVERDHRISIIFRDAKKDED